MHFFGIKCSILTLKSTIEQFLFLYSQQVFVRILTKNPKIMNTRKILFAIIASTTLLAVSCTPNTAEEDGLYEETVDVNEVKKPKNG